MKKTKKDRTQTQRASTHRASSAHPVDMGIEPFRRLGNAAPLFRVLLAGVKFPVKNIQDLHEKARSESRLLKFADGFGLTKLYSIKDVLDAIPELKDQLPLSSQEEMIDWIVKTEKKDASKTQKPQLICRIGNDHLKDLLNKPEYLASMKFPKQVTQMSPYLTINFSDYVRNCPDFASAEPPEDLCQFKKSAQASGNKISIEAVGYINNLNDEYAAFERKVADFCRNPDPTELADLERDMSDVCDYADTVKELATEALELAQSAYCDAKYIYEHWEDYAGMYFSDDLTCTRIEACDPDESVSTSRLVRDEAQDCYSAWEDGTHELWESPRSAYVDADDKCSYAKDLMPRLEAAALIETTRIHGYIVLPSENYNAPEGEVHSVKLEVYNASFQDLNTRFDDRNASLPSDCEFRDFKEVYPEDCGISFTDHYHFDVDGRYGPYGEVPSAVVITVYVTYKQGQSFEHIQQTWSYAETANARYLFLRVIDFCHPAGEGYPPDGLCQ